MLRFLLVGWLLVLGYYALRVSVLAVPDHCPDKTWESGPSECDYSLLDVAALVSLPILGAATITMVLVSVVQRLRTASR